jgi:hypothetical protein
MRLLSYLGQNIKYPSNVNKREHISNVIALQKFFEIDLCYSWRSKLPEIMTDLILNIN